MSKQVVRRSLPPRDGTALVRKPRQGGIAARSAGVAGAVLAPDSLALSSKAVAQAGEKARGFFGGLWDKGKELLGSAGFWLGIGGGKARDWIERKVVVPWRLWRSSEERKLAFTDAGGKAAEARLEPAGVIGGKQTFRVTYGKNSFLAEIPVGMDPDEPIKKVLEYFSDVPAHLRGALKVVNVENGNNPMDSYNEKRYGIEDFTSAATALNGEITFWDGTRNMGKGTFNHEMGHLIGKAIHDRDTDALGDFINTFQQIASPHDWKEVVRRDGNWVSDYAKVNPDEDFAEHWEEYLKARERGPEAVEEFRKTYPNRARFLEEVYEAH